MTKQEAIELALDKASKHSMGSPWPLRVLQVMHALPRDYGYEVSVYNESEDSEGVWSVSDQGVKLLEAGTSQKLAKIAEQLLTKGDVDLAARVRALRLAVSVGDLEQGQRVLILHGPNEGETGRIKYFELDDDGNLSYDQVDVVLDTGGRTTYLGKDDIQVIKGEASTGLVWPRQRQMDPEEWDNTIYFGTLDALRRMDPEEFEGELRNMGINSVEEYEQFKQKVVEEHPDWGKRAKVANKGSFDSEYLQEGLTSLIEEAQTDDEGTIASFYEYLQARLNQTYSGNQDVTYNQLIELANEPTARDLRDGASSGELIDYLWGALGPSSTGSVAKVASKLLDRGYTSLAQEVLALDDDLSGDWPDHTYRQQWKKWHATAREFQVAMSHLPWGKDGKSDPDSPEAHEHQLEVTGRIILRLKDLHNQLYHDLTGKVFTGAE